MIHHDQVRKRFTDKQVSAILKRAAEMQAARSDGAEVDPSAGFSLAQLQQAAAELGIDPVLIEEAASELERDDSPERKVSVWGGPSSIVIERIVEATVTEEDWPNILQELRNASGLVGTTTRVGRSFEWMAQGGDGVLHVTVTPQGDHTALRLMSRHADWGGAIYMAAGMAWFVGSLLPAAFGLPPLADAGLSAGLMGGLFAAARSGFNAVCRRKGRRAQQTMRVLEGVVARSAQAGVPAVRSIREDTQGVPVHGSLTINQ